LHCLWKPYVCDGSIVKCYSDLARDSQYRSSDVGSQTFHGSQDLNGTVTGTVNGTYPTTLNSPIIKFQADGAISGSPVVVNNLAYFGTTAGTLYCVDSLKGTKVWSNSYNCSILSTPAVFNGTVYTGADDGNIYALNATDGRLIWTVPAGGVNSVPSELTTWQTESSPMGANGFVIVGAQDGKLYCINQTTHLLMWTLGVSNSAVGNGGTPCVHMDKLNQTWVYMMANGNLWQICANNGSVVNQVSVGIPRASFSTPVFAYGSAATGTSGTLDGSIFITYGQGPTSVLEMRSAQNLTLYASIALDKTPATVYMAQTVAYTNPVTVNLVNQSNIGWGTDVASQCIVNQTVVGGLKTLTGPVVFVTEGSSLSCYAVIANNTNIGPQAGGGSSFVRNPNAPFYMVRLWSILAGQQVYSSPVVGTDPTVGQGVSTTPLVPTIYLGSDTFGVSSYNATSGLLFSTYSVSSPVFSSVALYDNRVYVTTENGYLYCFANLGGTNGYYPTSIYAASSKGTQMAVGEEISMQGRLTATSTFVGPYDPTLNQVFTPNVPYQPVKLTWVNPDQTSVIVTTRTDSAGYFNFTYSPTVAGSASWLVYFDGYETPGNTVLGQAYTAYNQISVLGEVTPPPQTPTPVPTQPPLFLPIEYIYAIAGVIVALIIIAAAIMLLRKRKK